MGLTSICTDGMLLKSRFHIPVAPRRQLADGYEHRTSSTRLIITTKSDWALESFWLARGPEKLKPRNRFSAIRIFVQVSWVMMSRAAGMPLQSIVCGLFSCIHALHGGLSVSVQVVTL